MAPAEIYRVKGQTVVEVFDEVERNDNPGEHWGSVKPGGSLRIEAGMTNIQVECDQDNKVLVRFGSDNEKEILSDHPPLNFSAFTVNKENTEWFIVRKTPK